MRTFIKIQIIITILFFSVCSLYASQLTWDASSGTVTGYRIYYGTSSGVYSGMEEVGNVLQYSMSSLSLQEKTTYYFVVKAYNTSGESSPSNEVSWYCPDTTPPSPPVNLSKQISSGNVQLTWTANTESDLQGYRVYQGTSSGIYSAPTPLGKVTTYTVSGLTQGSKYYFTITSVDSSSNESGYATEVNATIPDATIPTVAITSPTSASTYSTSSGAVSLSGSASDNVAVSSVRWTNAANSANGTATGTTSWSASSISLVSGSNAITVTASDAAGNTASKVLTVTYTPLDTTKPAVAITSPTTGATYSTSSGTVTLSGSASDNVGLSTVTWANAANSTSGTATGTTSWSVSGISLVSGSNAITVTASDAAGNISSASLTVIYSPVMLSIAQADTTAPTVSITAPTTSASYTTKSFNIKLSGNASDNVGVTKITWANAANGAKGTASGTTSWSTSNISLRFGSNIITITAYDSAGNSTKTQLTVTRRR